MSLVSWDDEERGTIGFTTSLGFSKKLDRIARDPRVAMAFHAREHGACRSGYRAPANKTLLLLLNGLLAKRGVRAGAR